MFSKIIFILAMVCVINASVITVNVFDDDPETHVAANPKSCNFQACEQLCRRLKFPGGACVNGRCKCDNFLNAEVEVAEKSVSDLDDLVSLKDDLDNKIEASLKSCNFQACDQLCRRLKFPGGACVNGRCKCDNFLNPEDGAFENSLFDLEDSVSQKDDAKSEFATKPSRCHSKVCDVVCRILNNTSGASSKESLSNLEEPVSPRGCTKLGCIEMCRKLKLNGGTCGGGRCVCRLSSQENAVPETLSNIVDSTSISLRKCNHQECNALCRKLLFREGVCIAGRCSCNNYIPVPKDAMTDLRESLSKQDNFLSNEDPLLLNAVTNDEYEDSNLKVWSNEEELITPLRACITNNCYQMCRRLNYAGGWCRGGSCRCY